MMQTQVIAAKPSHVEHDEETFHSLLDLQHRRCLQRGTAFHLLLCRLSTPDGAQLPMTASVKRALVSAMGESLGETDQIGWFLQDLVLGALLSSSDASRCAESNTSERNYIRGHIASRLANTYPSWVIQFYDFLDLPRVRGTAQICSLASPW